MPRRRSAATAGSTVRAQGCEMGSSLSRSSMGLKEGGSREPLRCSRPGGAGRPRWFSSGKKERTQRRRSLPKVAALANPAPVRAAPRKNNPCGKQGLVSEHRFSLLSSVMTGTAPPLAPCPLRPTIAELHVELSPYLRRAMVQACSSSRA
jgi:hypothetical protein